MMMTMTMTKDYDGEDGKDENGIKVKKKKVSPLTEPRPIESANTKEKDGCRLKYGEMVRWWDLCTETDDEDSGYDKDYIREDIRHGVRPVHWEVVHTQLDVQLQVFPLAKPANASVINFFVIMIFCLIIMLVTIVIGKK